MRYTQTQEYLEYISHRAAGDFKSALRSLKQCMEAPAVLSDPIEHAGLLQMIGSVLFEMGETEEALSHYDQSERRDPASLLMPYLHAKFLAEKLGRFREAIAKCDAIIARAEEKPFPKSEGDFSSEQYVRVASSLKKECIRRLSENI